MPGILPMKVIRVGSSAQARIAQACDRCRSKKIRCDGIRPCCTQCANVGFECKTSDKLSRRAFPRGYTESLEDRVRGLEAEVRELKDLLDEKDEKIDMLSRLQSFSPPSRKCSTALSTASSEQVKQELASTSEDVLVVEAPFSTSNAAGGASSTAAFIEAFDQKARDDGHDDADIRPEKFAQLSRPLVASSPLPKNASKSPPRLLSDQYINLFFQEWQPLLPILHRPSFLRIYEDYLSDPDNTQWQSNKQAVAQLFLIFEISALSLSSRIKQTTTPYESQWRRALQSTPSAAAVSTLQCHVLAELFYLLKADYSHLARHRAIATAMCHQLGLHQGHKYKVHHVFEAETRKKLFWSQYVLDKFASAATGSPMLLRDQDITTDLPADIDDENISAHGVSPTLPGELTRISSAIALFKVSKILSATLSEVYPASARYQLSLEKLYSLSDQLDQWSQTLPTHLRLQFKQDKPSTNVVSCRSPLLSLAYFHTRSLIHRPLVIHGSGSSASSSTIVLAAAGKHVLQILELLDERRMNYTFPFNKSELVMCSGFSILWQCLDLENDSKLFKDNQKTLNGLLNILVQESPMVAMEFQRIANTYIPMHGLARSPTTSSAHKEAVIQPGRHLHLMAAPEPKSKSARKSIQAIASRFSPSSTKPKTEVNARSKSIPTNGYSISPNLRTLSSASLSSTRSAPILPMPSPQPRQLQPRLRQFEAQPTINLDYFPLGDAMNPIDCIDQTRTPAKGQPHLNDTAWEQLLTNIDLTDTTSQDEIDTGFPDWTPPHDPDVWSIGDLTTKAAVPQSVLSFSEESLTSGEDLVFSRCASNNGSTGSARTAIDSLESSTIVEKSSDGFQGIAIPFDDDFEFHT